MADIHPFRAFRYTNDQQGGSPAVSPAQVVTQPYDKITPALQDRYYAASPYNLVRIILGRHEDANDNPANNVYSAIGCSFSRLAAARHPSPGCSTLAHTLIPNALDCRDRIKKLSPELERRGFIALGRIEDYSAGVVFRHEQTLAKPKADRLDLLRATRAHFGQIFMLYEDSGQVESMLRNYCRTGHCRDR